MVTCISLGSHSLFHVTSFGSCRAPYVGELHLRKVWCPVRLVTLNLLLITHVEIEEHNGHRVGARHLDKCIVTCIRLGTHSLFHCYILWKVKSTIRW